MRYPISLLLCAVIVLALSVTLLGPAVAGLASSPNRDQPNDPAATELWCGSSSLTHAPVRPYLLSYWLLGRESLSPDNWLDGWKQSGLRLESDTLAAAPATNPGRTAGPLATIVDVTIAPSNQLVFLPSTVTINVGDTVRWTFASVGHDLVSGSACVPDDGFCWPNNLNCGSNGN